MIYKMDGCKKLRKCPFCGGEARLFHEHIANVKHSYVSCLECDVKGGHIPISTEYSSDEQAIEAWNMRRETADNDD